MRFSRLSLRHEGILGIGRYYCAVLRVKCEGERHSIIILLLRRFVVLTADQFVGRDDGPLEQQRQNSHVC